MIDKDYVLIPDIQVAGPGICSSHCTSLCRESVTATVRLVDPPAWKSLVSQHSTALHCLLTRPISHSCNSASNICYYVLLRAGEERGASLNRLCFSGIL